MAGAWTINAGGRVYGPFSTERMRSFASEGRLASSSLVAREDSSDWREAREEPTFADLFPQTEPAITQTTTQRPVSPPPPMPAPSHDADVPRTQFAIVVDVKSRGSGNLEQVIASFGPSYQLLPNVWIVSSDQTANAVRNRLVQELGKSDSLFVVDASRGKAAWFNFGPDADVRIRRVWQKSA
jgi:hypothetical protein